ncbi:hypothetical protein KVMX100_190014 [Klebsiella variicola]|nr:hypothetical protein KVMX100_190014 [Klebsiella variicola]
MPQFHVDVVTTGKANDGAFARTMRAKAVL